MFAQISEQGSTLGSIGEAMMASAKDARLLMAPLIACMSAAAQRWRGLFYTPHFVATAPTAGYGPGRHSCRPFSPLLVSSWLNVAMYAFELVLCGHYFTRPSRPLKLIHKLGVGGLIVADGLCVITINCTVVLTITGETTRNAYAFVAPLSTQIILTYVSAAIAQLFFCDVYYTLTKNRLISAVLLLLIVVHVSFSWASAIMILQVPIEATSTSYAITAVGAISCAATDIIVAVCLAANFWRLMQHAIPGRKARSIVQRVLILSVASGAICGSATMVSMILLLDSNPAFNFIFALQGRIYALSILGNFLLGVPGATRDTSTQPFDSTLSHSVVFRVPDSMNSSSRISSHGAGGKFTAALITNGMQVISAGKYVGDDQESMRLEDLEFTCPQDKAAPEEG
ncbi:hypothetical protein K438DRAFT_1963084 [Mycena galopus ATCC 62051]|nr:hypothetical protein K438DRAFT_1963084 [Mycena galopus ATCC 62051]